MTTIQDIPEELLFMIFKNCYDYQLNELQYICRAWYFPAHILFLKEVELDSKDCMERFMASIDHNPRPSYLKAIQILTLSNDDNETEGSHQLSNEEIEKLFFRFPNLRTVKVLCFSTLFQGFTDKTCETFLKRCPKLDSFEINLLDDTTVKYIDMTYKLRLLIDKLNFDKIGIHTSQYGNPVQFISSFPRLRVISSIHTKPITSFQDVLSIVENLPNLTNFPIFSADDNDEDFVEIDLMMTKEVVKRLSQIKALSWTSDSRFKLSQLKFIVKYLTGLESIKFISECNAVWTDEEQELVCNEVLDLLCITNPNSYLILKLIPLRILSARLPSIVHKLFQQIPSAIGKKTKRTIFLNISNEVEIENFVNIGMENFHSRFSSERKITIAVNSLRLSKIAANLFSDDNSLNSADKFTLEIPKRNKTSYTQRTDIDMYDKILKRMPLLKVIIMDIPESFEETGSTHLTHAQEYFKTVHPLVEDLTLRATPDAKFQTLLDRYSFAFPNVNRLYIYYFSGIWKGDLGEFQMILPKYSLEYLEIDVTPVKTKMMKYLKKPRSDGGNFFVLEVESLQSGEHQKYKVIMDDSEVTKINSSDLKNLIRGEDYLRLHVTVKSLKCLNLRLFIKKHSYQDETNYLHGYSGRYVHFITVFNKTG